jgi:hypothetical protein
MTKLPDQIKSLWKEICVLTAFGTAAVLSPSIFAEISLSNSKELPIDDEEEDKDEDKGKEKKAESTTQKPRECIPPLSPSTRVFPFLNQTLFFATVSSCSFVHTPDRGSNPSPSKLVRCAMCRRHRVPEILLSTVELPREVQLASKGSLLEARVCRMKKKAQGEPHAFIVSEAIPFIEYDLHRQIIYKLKVLGMNAAFGLQLQLSVGENAIIATATATAVTPPCLFFMFHVCLKT